MQLRAVLRFIGARAGLKQLGDMVGVRGLSEEGGEPLGKECGPREGHPGAASGIQGQGGGWGGEVLAGGDGF